MSSLKQNQAAFLKLVTTPKEMDEVLAEHPDLEHHIAESEKFPAARRIKIYSTAYYLRILETMKDNYPRLLEKMGEEAFATLIGDYLLAHPPSNYSLNHIDQDFVTFIRDPALADIALYEKTRIESFLSRDSQSMTLNMLQQVPADKWMGLELKLIPSCILVEFRREEEKPLLFFRPEYDVQYRPVDETEIQLIQQLQQSPRFDLLCERAAELCDGDDAISLVGNYLVQWVNDGIITALD